MQVEAECRECPAQGRPRSCRWYFADAGQILWPELSRRTFPLQPKQNSGLSKRPSGQNSSALFRRIGLPVCVRHEADCRVEGQVRCRLLCAESRRIQRQKSLKALDQIRESKADRAKRQKRSRVPGPMLFRSLLNSGQCIYPSFQAAECGMQKCSLPFIHPRHVGTKRLRQRKKHNTINQYLEYTLARHGIFPKSAPASGAHRADRQIGQRRQDR